MVEREFRVIGQGFKADWSRELNTYSHFNLGLLYAQSGDVESAVGEFERATTIEPSNQAYSAALLRARQEAGIGV